MLEKRPVAAAHGQKSTIPACFLAPPHSDWWLLYADAPLASNTSSLLYCTAHCCLPVIHHWLYFFPPCYLFSPSICCPLARSSSSQGTGDASRLVGPAKKIASRKNHAVKRFLGGIDKGCGGRVHQIQETASGIAIVNDECHSLLPN